uniref:Uncharacterized protein n=1 Tax=Rhizophora mucronata TaxID=61149 RepID=A0A2P2P159_RHIMU
MNIPSAIIFMPLLLKEQGATFVSQFFVPGNEEALVSRIGIHCVP